MISIITPLHAPGNRFIEQAYKSICRQSGVDWQWCVLENRGGRVPPWIRSDRRVRVSSTDVEGVGALKRQLCERADGDRIVELDADDLLAPRSAWGVGCALEHVAAAFDAGADFVYSDFAEFTDAPGGLSKAHYPYSSRAGWRSYEVAVGGRQYVAMRAPAATAHNVRLVDWAPNHVRAWTRASYDRVGGHDASMRVADDHDLVVRMFLAGARFAHVPRCLYLYRVHADNTVRHENAAIRAGTWRVYERSVWALAERWARDRGLARVDLCGGVDSPDGYVRVDRDLRGGVGVECDLDGTWPLETSSVGVLRAVDAIEHLRDPVHTMNEAHRVLAPGGFFMISVPSTTGTVRVEGKGGPVDVTVAGRGADCDPTHVSRWNRLSFRYYTDPAFARYVPAFRGRFQVGRVLEWFPSDWHREEGLPYVDAQLFAVKDGYRPMGDLLWPEPSVTC